MENRNIDQMTKSNNEFLDSFHFTDFFLLFETENVTQKFHIAGKIQIDIFLLKFSQTSFSCFDPYRILVEVHWKGFRV